MADEINVFISYARIDEQFATDLMNRLGQEPDIAPWQDRIKMSPGDFEDQIKAGIDTAQYVVLVMTPAALRSPWVEKEWRYARETGKCIVPIKPQLDSVADAELEDLRTKLPIWMQKIQTYDFKGYWKRFLAVLQSPCQATRTPFLAANLPANFVPRPGTFDPLITAVLDQTRKNPSGKTVTLYGIGGFGKTTLALSVCHDPDVFAAFDGGVLWVTLGENPNIVPELEKIYAALTGQRPGFNGQDDAMFQLGKKLEGTRSLIVIDDVWRPQDLKPFLHNATSCSRLITTRIFNIAVANSAEPERINVAEPTDEEADRILTSGLQIPVGSLGHIKTLSARLKRVPLLLQLANRTLQQQVALGDTIDAALHWALQRYIDFGVFAFDENTGGRHDAIANTIEVSLSFLKDERQRCLELGVLHEDTDVPFSVLGTLWNLKETEVQDLAQRLNNFGLVKLNLPQRSIRLHDYIRGYLEHMLADPPLVHARLADAWKDLRRLPAAYARQHISYHLTEALKDPRQIVERAGQFVSLLTDARYSDYQRQHGDAAALDLKLMLAIRRCAESTAPQLPGLIASLAVLRKSYAARARDAALVFESASNGQIEEAIERLTLFEADGQWDTLARLLISWVAPADKAQEAHRLTEETAKACNSANLQTALAWVRSAPNGIPPNLQPISGGPNLRYVSAILQRAGGAEKLEGLEPLDFDGVASGIDANGFIAHRDGPDLVAFAKLDPQTNTEYLERYIDIHAANRYVHYRNVSLLMLLEPILQFPDPQWVRRLVQRIVIAALTGASIDFEECLPLAIRAVLAYQGDAKAAADLDAAKQRLLQEAASLRPEAGQTDIWSHQQRRAAMFAEIFIIAGHNAEAADFLKLGRELPKGFAGLRAFSALSLADGVLIAAAGDPELLNAALLSATAASHRIQDPPFCLKVTAEVNAVRFRWANLSGADLEATIKRFIGNPLAAEFCAVHRVLEDFEYRTKEHDFQAIPIPYPMRKASTLSDIAAIFDYEPEALARVNDWIWAGESGVLGQGLNEGDEVNIPDPDFIPILAARFSAEAFASAAIPPERRTLLIQRLVHLALPNPTALDTVLGRLMLSTIARPTAVPPILKDLKIPDSPPTAGAVEKMRGLGVP